MFFKNKNFQISFFSFGMPIIIYLLMIKLNMLLADPKMSDYWALGEHFYNFWSFEGFGYTVRTYPASLYQAVLRFIVGGDIYYALFLQTLIYCLSLYYFIKAYFDLIPKWAFLLIGSSPLLMYILNTYNAEPLQLTLYLFMLAVGKKFIDTKQTKYFIIMLFFGSLMYAATSRVLFLPLFTLLVFYYFVYGKQLLKMFLIVFLFIGLGEIIKIPSTLNNIGKEANYTLGANLKWGIWAGAKEFPNFPHSMDFNNKIFEEHPEVWNGLDTDYIALFKEYLITNPDLVLRNYIFKLYRVWVPMQTYEGQNKSLGVKLSILYGTIVFFLFLAGIYLSYKHEKNRLIFWVMFLPMIFHWTQHIILITYSGYMTLARIPQLYFAGFALWFLFDRLKFKFLK